MSSIGSDITHISEISTDVKSNIVLVVSKAPENHFDSRKNDYIKIFKDEKDSKEFKQQSPVIHTSNGFLVTVNDTIYAITNYHGVKHSDECYIYTTAERNITKYKTCNTILCPDFDLALLEITKIKEDDIKINNVNIECCFPKIGEQCTILSKTLLQRQFSRITIEEISCRVKGITFDNFVIMSPPVPIIELEFSDEKTYDLVLDGISGSPVIYNNSVIGCVSNIPADKTKTLHIIPSCCIMRILNELKHTRTYSGICNIAADMITSNDHDDTKQKGIILSKVYKVKYENDISRSEDEKKHIKLKDNDIIFCINDIKVDEHGCFYDKTLEFSIPLHTYIALNYFVTTKIPLLIMRYQQKKKEYIMKNISLPCRTINSMIKIPYIHSHNYFVFNGLVLTEASEEIMQYFQNHDIELTGFLPYVYANDIYTNKPRERIVIVEDLLFGNIDNTMQQKYQELHFPIMKLENNKFCLPVVTQINNRRVINLSQMRQYVESLRSSKAVDQVTLTFRTVNDSATIISYKAF